MIQVFEATKADAQPIEHLSGAVCYVGTGHVDADGSGGNPWGDPDFQPRTSLKRPDGNWLNANEERYIAVPPGVVSGVRPIVLGCQAWVLYRGHCVSAVVADVGPAGKLGELSVACARAMGMNPSPTRGGEDKPVVHYILWPGIPAQVDGRQYHLQAS